MEGDKDKGALELKSNEDGMVTIDVIPIGDTVRLQVIADGWKTFGDDYKIETDSKEIVVKMKRPTEQYSLYGDGHGTATSTTAPASTSSPRPCSDGSGCVVNVELTNTISEPNPRQRSAIPSAGIAAFPPVRSRVRQL